MDIDLYEKAKIVQLIARLQAKKEQAAANMLKKIKNQYKKG